MKWRPASWPVHVLVFVAMAALLTPGWVGVAGQDLAAVLLLRQILVGQPFSSGRLDVVLRLLGSAPGEPGAASPDSQILRAEAYASARQWRLARASYSRLGQDPGYSGWAANRLEGLAAAYHWCPADSEDARSLFAALVDAASTAERWSEVCAIGQNLDASIAAQAEALSLSPTSARAAQLAWLYYARASSAGARPAADRQADYQAVIGVLEQYPPVDAGRSQYILAWSYWQVGKFERAIAQYKNCLTAAVNDLQYRLYCTLNLGYVYASWLPVSQQDPDQARAYFEQALALATSAPDRAQIKLALGQLALQRADAAGAVQDFSQALGDQPNCVDCHLGLAQAYLALGERDQAGAQYRAVLALAPGEPRATEGLKALGAP